MRAWQAGRTRADYLTVAAERGPVRVGAQPIAADGTFVLRGMPPGLWTLRATTPHGATSVDGIATGSTGVTLEMPSLGPDVEAGPR